MKGWIINLKTEERKKIEKNEKIKINKKILIYLIIALVTIYLIYTIYLLIKQPTDIFMLEEGTLYSEETVVGYIIRDEVVLEGEKTQNEIIQIKNEGEKVAINEPVFRYSSSKEESLRNKIN